MSIALFILTLLFPPQTSSYTPLPLTPAVTNLTPRHILFDAPTPVAPVLPRRLAGIKVTATVYWAEARQTDSDPLVTADNSRISRNHSSKNRWMAVSRDMLKKNGGKFEYGDSIEVSGISPELDGTYVVHDTMNRRLHRTIDLLVNKNEKIYGRWDNVRISKVPAAELQWQAS
jgi:3D (Asp-Asp-Asp) domain-containing protein